MDPPQLDPADYLAALHGGSRAEQMFHTARVELLTAALPRPAGRILDVGAGSGGIAIPLAEAGHDVTAVEVGFEHLTRLRDYAMDRGLTVPVIQADGRRLPFAEGSFDVVILASVVHLASQPGPLLREAERVCKDGGTLLVAGPWRHHPKANRLIKTILRGGRAPETKTWPFSKALVRRYLGASELVRRDRDYAMGYDVTVWRRLVRSTSG
jgi:SAM-dependent methyltransferase